MMSSNTLNTMRSGPAWNDDQSLKKFCAAQLLAGRLSIVLGAGVSMGSGLPSWTALVDRCFKIVGASRPTNATDELASELLLSEQCADDEQRFAAVVHEALYQNYTSTGLELSKVDLIAALGALAMPSVRGGVRRIVSFNFDDLLEQFLAAFGVCVESQWQLPAWESRSDVRVYHPHGFLPFDKRRGLSSGIVMAQSQYDKIVGNSRELWRHGLLDILRSNTCLFIGLSGNDPNLRSLLNDAKESHVTKSEHPFWGVRFSNRDDDLNKVVWQKYGVVHLNVGDYLNVPPWLFEVCQLAAEENPLCS